MVNAIRRQDAETFSPRVTRCPAVAGSLVENPTCKDCGQRVYGNRNRCVPCKLGWSENQRGAASVLKAREIAEKREAARQRALNVASRLREENERAARIKALASVKEERDIKARIAKQDADRESMPARLAAIRAAATARQRRAQGI